MNKQCYRKSLDLQKNGVQWSVDIKINDVNSRKIVISLTDGGKTFNLDENMIVTVYAKKPDENIIYSNCKIESGLVIFEPTKQCISAEGTVNCELRIYSENSSGSQLLTSPRFSIEVYGVLSNEEHLVSTNEYSALTEATMKAQEATAKANDIADEITQKLESGELKGSKGEQGPQGEQGIQGVPGTTDFAQLQNLPRTLCSGTLELTEITDGGYEASDVTSVTYNGVEKFKLDKGNLLFLKENTVNIQNGYGCYCIDNIPEEANDDWTKYYGVTEKELQKRNRNPEIYIIPYKDYKINKEFKLLYTDVWMVASDLENFNKYKSKIDVDFGIVPDNLKESFVKAVMDGFSGEAPEDPYEAVNDGYGTALYNSFKNLESEYKSIHYAGKYNREIVSTATVVYKGENAIIYNVTTKKQYQKMGICKEMM